MSHDTEEKSDAEFEEKLTLGFKNDMSNLVNFNASLKICTLMCYFCQKYIVFEPKKQEGFMAITLKNDANFEMELTCALKSDIRNS